MKEDVVQFGLEDRLVGVLTTPATALRNAPACLLMNAGVIHRIGPHRLNANISPALAAHAIATLHGDLSVLGARPAAVAARISLNKPCWTCRQPWITSKVDSG
jgi:hypothetical protein